MSVQRPWSAVARWSRSVLLVGSLSMAALLAAAAPGAARPASAGDCPFSDTVCLFEGANYTGERFAVSSLDPSGTCVSLVDHGWGDRAHSALNTNSTSAAMFMNDDCVGDPFQIPGNTGLPSFGGFTPESIWVP